MTDAPKVLQLTPAEWKQQCLFSVAQLHAYLESIPPHTEAGASSLTADVMAGIEVHVARGRSFLRAWQLSRVPGVVAPAPSVPQQKATGNGHAGPKKKGGWPKGKKRTPLPQGAVQ